VREVADAGYVGSSRYATCIQTLCIAEQGRCCSVVKKLVGCDASREG
jgi:hypothetical protein